MSPVRQNNNTLYVEQNPEAGQDSNLKNFDDDGQEKRTGTMVTASAHIITAVIGSGVLSLAWAIAQLGWLAGPAVLFTFSFITYFTSRLLADCYRSPGPEEGKRNYTYSDVVRAHLGGVQVWLCGLAQYSNLVGVTIGYTITASISMVAVRRSNCFHKHGHGAKCDISNNPSMMIFAAIQIVLSQIPNFHKLSWLSILAAVMSFAYASIGLGLSIAKVAGGAHSRTSLTGVTVGVDVTGSEKVWKCFQALGDIAFAYAYSTVLIEIQIWMTLLGATYAASGLLIYAALTKNTLRSHPPENKVMKKASGIGVSTTTLFYILCGCVGYAAFGNDAPGNFLTGFGFYEPFWLVDLANIFIAVHLVGAYQVFAQPIFGFVESQCKQKWPENRFMNTEHVNAFALPLCGSSNINIFRLVWRTAYVIITALIAMIFPFFNSILGLIGAGSFYPLTVYFPIEMHIAQAQIPKYSARWICLKLLSYVCLVISLVAAAGSLEGLSKEVKKYKLFQTHY